MKTIALDSNLHGKVCPEDLKPGVWWAISGHQLFIWDSEKEMKESSELEGCNLRGFIDTDGCLVSQGGRR